jgi:hypothetical protein
MDCLNVQRTICLRINQRCTIERPIYAHGTERMRRYELFHSLADSLLLRFGRRFGERKSEV